MTASCPMVLLRHVLPAGSEHFDWLLARDDSGATPLRSFRTAVRVDQLAPGDEADLESAADHRPVYLHFEGAVSAAGGDQPNVDRGVVQRVAEGTWAPVAGDHPDELWDVQWSGGRSFQLMIRGAGGARWCAVRVAESGPRHAQSAPR